MLMGRLKALVYSFAGLAATWKTEIAFRIECVLAVILIPLGFWLGETGLERAMLIGAINLVLIVELLNSAIEVAIDRVGSEIHPLSKIAKDTGSAAVFLSLLGAGAIWALILL